MSVSSPYEEMFGKGYVGRPLAEEMPTGVVTGDPVITAAARRRATRVLKALRREEFNEIMRQEAEWLRAKGRAGK